MNIKSKEFWTDGWGSFAVAILIALTIRWGFFEAYVIPSGSMLPSLLIHDHIFVNKFTYGLRVPFSKQWLTKFSEPKRGEVVVFKYPKNESTFFVKRLVGLPGDRIRYENGSLYINDVAMEKMSPEGNSEADWLRDRDFQRDGDSTDRKENYAHFIENLMGVKHSVLTLKSDYYPTSYGPTTVPEGHYFMMGDNRNRSSDSRIWGFMPEENILGRASVVWLSCEEMLPYVPFLCNPLTIRWKRFFHLVN